MVYIKKWIDYYSELFAVEPEQVNFFNDLVANFKSPSKLLSVECGPALLSDELSKTSDITVTDSFPEFINVVNNKHVVHNNEFHCFNLNPFDIARYLGKNFFNVITSLDYRLIFMKERTMIKKFMFDVKMLLSDGGYFVIDLINFSKFDFAQTKIDLPVKKCERATLYSSLVKNSETATYQLFQHVVTSSGKVIDVAKAEDVCPISHETLKNWAEELKYSSIEFFSDYKKTPYSKNSDRIICVLRK